MTSKLAILGLCTFGLLMACTESSDDSPSNQVSTFQDERDQKRYKISKVGQLEWMTENLNYGKRIELHQLPSDQSVTEKFCVSDDLDSCQKYGGLYTFAEALNLPDSCSKRICKLNLDSNIVGICPAGWRLPRYSDIDSLVAQVGAWSSAGLLLQNDSSLAVHFVPAGLKYDQGTSVGSVGQSGYYLVLADSSRGSDVHVLLVNSNSEKIQKYWIAKNAGFSVKCVR